MSYRKILQTIIDGNEIDKAQLVLEGRCDTCGLLNYYCDYSNNHKYIVTLQQEMAPLLQITGIMSRMEQERFIT